MTNRCSNELGNVRETGINLQRGSAVSLSLSQSATSCEEKAMSWLRDKNGETAVNAGAKGSKRRGKDGKGC